MRLPHPWLARGALALLLAGCAFHPREREVWPYAAAAQCATVDTTPGALILLDVTPATMDCTSQWARLQPNVFLVAARPELAFAAARRTPGKVIAVGPVVRAPEVASQVSAAVRSAVEALTERTGQAFTPTDITPEQAVRAAAPRFGWLLR